MHSARSPRVLEAMNRVCAQLIVVVVVASGCAKEASAPAASPPKVETSKPAPPAPPDLRNAAGKLTRAGVDAAWDSIFLASATMNDPAEKKLAALEAKLGAPAKVEEGKRVWWAFDGEACFRVELGTDGGKSVEKIFEPELCEK